ncbi:TonB-dependent receptor [Flavobacterium sp. A45]|uniref:TonB-dependent receptor n=1 Tax=Flavobacterium sp. A45 TaxID=1945862 RepID=UPI000986BBC3|nr:TonB-dependent receptor [Flavobacterium sp. A45]OOG77960.1 collagen-binding protein [Flavobacterium sp. A45]
MISKKIIYIFVLLFTSLHSFSQDMSNNDSAKQKFTLSGTISDSNSNETLIGVNVMIPELKTGVITNEYGFFSITLPKGIYKIQITSIGFQTIDETINLDKNTKMNFKLMGSENVLKEVVINSNDSQTENRKPEMGVNKLSVATIKKMPVVLGEVDIIKSILLLPGVTNAGEAASGFNVRGGGADQNLILMDEASIFNSSHVFGFFSIFNPDAIKDIKLYKGGIPARYGGRASSVLDIYQKDGNSKDFHMSGGIGLITSRLLAEGPIVKDKGSFLIAGRASYAHLFLKLSEEQKDNAAYFYDLNAKLSYKLTPNNNLYMSGYFGRDVFSINKSFTNIYGNTTFNTRWNHLFSDKLFSNLSAIFSDYYYGLDLDFVGFEWRSGIKNFNIKYDFRSYVSDKLKLNFGVNGIYYEFNPGTIKPSSTESGINPDQLEKKYAYEPAIYINAEQKITERIDINYGLRYSLFYNVGSSTVNLYENNNPVLFNSQFQIYEKATPIGTKQYSKNEVIKSFDYLEPRLSVNYLLNDNQSFQASYNRMVQYLQLISNTSSPTPLDVWTPSGTYIKPQIADQVALGYFRKFKEGAYSAEVSSFYKEVQNRLDYIDGANLIANKAIEQVLLNGQLRSYGLELMLKKNEGKLTGWISYTLSKSEQQTPGRTPDETGINNGQWYNTAYDKVNNLAVTGSYYLNPKWAFGANFIYQTGQPTTYPNGQYEYLGMTIPIYGLRNKERLPSFNHLDISATLTPKPNYNKNWRSEWVFSIYNVYNRKNAASIGFRENMDTGANEAVKTSIFGIVPAVSYNFKF